jgi:hypothetical protein
MTVDPAALLREFGLSALLVLGAAWTTYSFFNAIAKSVLPAVATAVVERIKAGTALTDATRAAVSRIPDVVSESGRETRAAIASFERVMIESEGRITNAFAAGVMALKDEIFDHKQERVEKALGRLSRPGADSDNPPPRKVA